MFIIWLWMNAIPLICYRGANHLLNQTMNTKKQSSRIATLAAAVLLSANSFAQNPNFHIYLCFGQSNMEGQGTIESQDKKVDSRFKVLAAVDCSNLGRTKGNWYTAVPPLFRCFTHLSPADYFGRTMVANLPDSIIVGVVNVAIGGCDIRLFDKRIYTGYDSTYTEAWFQDALKQYGGNPYQHLVELAKLAQKDGVIKGILLHQGETNTGDTQWPAYVKTIYTDLLADLSLSADQVPLIAGEVVSSQYSGCCSRMNTIIRTLPQAIPSAHVVSSKGCPDQPDNAHFNAEGYRILGRRYAVQMLSLMGYEAVYAEAECSAVCSNWNVKSDASASNGSYTTPAAGTSGEAAPVDDAGLIKFNFTVGKDTAYHIFGRFSSPDAGNSYWVKVDGGAYQLNEISAATGWQWLEIATSNLTAGEHSVCIGLSKHGLLFDKLAVKNSTSAPVSIGEEAANMCIPVISTGALELNQDAGKYSLEQNVPNPHDGYTDISFEITSASVVSLKVYTAQGGEIAELAGHPYTAGRHTVQCCLDSLADGNYYYTLKADGFSATRYMIVSHE